MTVRLSVRLHVGAKFNSVTGVQIYLAALLKDLQVSWFMACLALAHSN
jgi:hypothetical protein